MPKKKVAQAMIGRTPVPVGKPSHRQDSEHQEGAGDSGHEHDDARAHPERGLDVRRKDAQTGALEVVQGHDDRKDHERRGAGLSQALPQGRPLLARPRQQVLGEDDLLLGPRRPLAFLCGVGEEAGQFGGTVARRGRRAGGGGSGTVAHGAPDPNVPGRSPPAHDGFIGGMLRPNNWASSEILDRNGVRVRTPTRWPTWTRTPKGACSGRSARRRRVPARRAVPGRTTRGHPRQGW